MKRGDFPMSPSAPVHGSPPNRPPICRCHEMISPEAFKELIWPLAHEAATTSCRSIILLLISLISVEADTAPVAACGAALKSCDSAAASAATPRSRDDCIREMISFGAILHSKCRLSARCVRSTAAHACATRRCRRCHSLPVRKMAAEKINILASFRRRG